MHTAKESIDNVAIAPNQTEVQKVEFINYADQFSSLFLEAPCTTNLIKHHINRTTEDPVRRKPYQIPYSVRKELKKDIEDMIKMGTHQRINIPLFLT